MRRAFVLTTTSSNERVATSGTEAACLPSSPAGAQLLAQRSRSLRIDSRAGNAPGPHAMNPPIGAFLRSPIGIARANQQIRHRIARFRNMRMTLVAAFCSWQDHICAAFGTEVGMLISTHGQATTAPCEATTLREKKIPSPCVVEFCQALRHRVGAPGGGHPRSVSKGCRRVVARARRTRWRPDRSCMCRSPGAFSGV